MKITWIGHSCFKVEKDGYSIIIDPYEDDYIPGYQQVREEAHMILCSHEHKDHNARHCVRLLPEQKSPFTITTIETFHDCQNGAQRGKNKIHILDDGVHRIAHLGDLGAPLGDEQIAALVNLDAVLIPIGGYYTINAAQAEKIIDQIKPRMAIPMHYYSNDKHGISFGYSVLDGVSDFLEDFDSVQTLTESAVDTSNIPAKIVVLHPRNVGKD